MNSKDKSVAIIVILLGLGIFMAYITSSSFAYQYNVSNYNLFYKDDTSVLSNDIEHYIALIDDYLIPNSSYNYSEILTENYDFLTNFALDYIVNNKEAFSDKIVYLDKHTYYDKYGSVKETDEYININEIYKITSKYFGIRDYKIIGSNINIINNYVSLNDNGNGLFKGIIKDTKVVDNNDSVIAYVKYDNDNKFKYTFKNINNELKLYNIEGYDE